MNWREIDEVCTAIIGILSFMWLLVSAMAMVLSVVWDNDFLERVSATSGMIALFVFIVAMINQKVIDSQ